MPKTSVRTGSEPGVWIVHLFAPTSAIAGELCDCAWENPPAGYRVQVTTIRRRGHRTGRAVNVTIGLMPRAGAMADSAAIETWAGRLHESHELGRVAEAS